MTATDWHEATPVGATLARVRDLEELRRRVDAELDDSYARLRRLGYRIGPGQPPQRVAQQPRPRPQAAVVRAWARANGVPVGARGLPHPDVFDAYLEAHP